MFTNLIESQSHRKDFKRRGSFVLFTTAVYALFFVFAGVLSIYAYDAQLEDQDLGLEVLEFIPPVAVPPEAVHPDRTPPRSGGNENGPVREQRLPELYENSANPRTPPATISAAAQPIPPARAGAIKDANVFDAGSTGRGPGPIGPGSSEGGNGNVVANDVGEPPPIPVKPPARPVTIHKSIINGLAISLPAPPYPSLAKQIGMQGVVSVQVLLDENGKVVSAKAVSGHPMLAPAAVNAAYQARFSPTLLNGVPVKVSGVITYNFMLNR